MEVALDAAAAANTTATLTMDPMDGTDSPLASSVPDAAPV